MEYLKEIIVGLIITIVGGLILYYLFGVGRTEERRALKVTEKAKGTQFVDSEVVGGAEIAGQDTQLLRTKIRDFTKSFSIVKIISLLAALATIFGVGFAIYSYYAPNIKSTDGSSNQNVDLRGTLVGYSSIFDLVAEIHELSTDIDRKDLAGENLNKKFSATGTMLELGRFDGGELWVTVEGTDSNNRTQVMECHFDDSWESTLRSLFNNKKRQIEFNGEIAFYKQYWLVARDCEIIGY